MNDTNEFPVPPTPDHTAAGQKSTADSSTGSTGSSGSTSSSTSTPATPATPAGGAVTSREGAPGSGVSGQTGTSATPPKGSPPEGWHPLGGQGPLSDQPGYSPTGGTPAPTGQSSESNEPKQPGQ